MIGKHIPNSEDCWVEPQKIERYLMNLEHMDGAPKASFFMAHGFTQSDLAALGSALTAHPKANLVVASETNAYGLKSVVECTIQTPDRRNPCIRSVWIDEGDGKPRLVTAYPNP